MPQQRLPRVRTRRKPACVPLLQDGSPLGSAVRTRHQGWAELPADGGIGRFPMSGPI